MPPSAAMACAASMRCAAWSRRMRLGQAQVKIRFDADKTGRDVDLAGDIAKARAVRKLVGDDFPLAFDANNGYSVQGAIRVGRVLEELGYVWFEEPVQHYHTASLGKVADALDIAVSAGEQEYTLQGVQRLIEAGVDIVQPDIVKTGGFSGLSDMAVLARAHGVDFVPIRPNHPSAIAPTLHFIAALMHAHYPCEYNGPYGVQDGVFTALCGRWGANLCSPMRQAWDWSSLKLSCRSAWISAMTSLKTPSPIQAVRGRFFPLPA